MRNLRTLAAIGLLAAAGAASAGVSSTWTLTNDYDFRGNTQTAKDPAVQASLDFATDSGWYVGAWASNVDFGDDTDYEVDLYTGFTKSYDSGLTWDVGGVLYAYPDTSDYNYFEVYGSVAYDWFKAKIWYSPAFGGDAAEAIAIGNTGTDDVAAFYLEANATFPLPANFNFQLHAGISKGDYWDNVAGDDILDYSAGFGYSVGHFTLGLKYVDTDTDATVTTDVFNNEGRVIFTIATTFPWSEE